MKTSEQSLLQLMPAGLLVTVPLPVPNSATVKVDCGINRLNTAVTNWSESIGTMQVPVPEQAPLHPSKVDPGSGPSLSG